jgi:hypothetical protein
MIVNLGCAYGCRNYDTKEDVIYTGFSSDKKIKRSDDGNFRIKVNGEIKIITQQVLNILGREQKSITRKKN